MYYALVPTAGVPIHCVLLMNRAVAGQVTIYVSVPVLSDVIHKVMTSEAAQITGRDRAGMVGYLNKHPEIIAQLKEYPQAMNRLRVVPMNVLPVDQPLLNQASQFAVELGLLSNDALIVALMKRQQLTHLVTNDDDFDRVLGLTIWKPR